MIKVQPVIENGVKWYPFNLSFKSDEGVFEVTLYAVSFEHAECLLEDLKSTGKIVSQTIAREA